MALQRFDVVPLHQRATLPKAPQKAVIRNTPAPKSMASGRNCALVRPSKRKNSGMFFLLHRDQSNLIPLDPEAALTGPRPAEIFFSATFSLPQKNSPIPPSYWMAN
jgi:hypothetical protein